MNAFSSPTEIWTTDQACFRSAVSSMLATYCPDACFKLSDFKHQWEENFDAALALVNGMMTITANHLTAQQAIKRFKPLELCVLLAGSNTLPEAWVAPVAGFEGGYVMALSPGLITSLADPFMRHMTYPGFLGEIGDVNLCPEQWSNLLLGDLPVDPERLQAGTGLALMGLLVVLYHELAHILRGHSAYYAAQSGFAHMALKEFMPLHHGTRSYAEAQLLRRALEIDADMTAGRFWGTIVQQLDILKLLLPSNMDVSWATGYVVSTVFYCLGQQTIRDKSFHNGYHLPANRVESFLTGYSHNFPDRNEDLMREGVTIAFELINQTDGLFESFHDVEQDIDAIEAETWPYLLSLRDQLKQCIPAEWLQEGVETSN